MEYIQGAIDFIYSESFWESHGMWLAGLWILGSVIGVFIKKWSANLHALSFAIVDYPSLYFGIGGLIRVWPSMPLFWEWTLPKQLHVIGGLLILAVITYQHALGVISHYTGKSDLTHRKIGAGIGHFARIVVILGYMKTDNKQMMILSASSAILIYLSQYLSVKKIKSSW